MMKPAILSEVDALLEDNPPADIRAWGDETIMRQVRDYADGLDGGDTTIVAMPTAREWRYRGVSVVVATTPGSGTRIVPGSG